MYSYISPYIFSRPTVHPLFYTPGLHLAIISYLILRQKYYWQLQCLLYMLHNTKLHKHHLLSSLTSHLLVKTTTKLFLVFISLILFYVTLNLYLVFSYFSKGCLNIMCEDLLCGCYSLLFELSGKGLPLTSVLLFFQSQYIYLNGFLWVAQTKNHLNVTNL